MINNRAVILGMSVGLAFLLTICIVAIALVSGTSLIFTPQETAAKPIRIAQIKALDTPATVQKVVDAVPIQAAAVLERPVDPNNNDNVSADATATATPMPMVTPTATPTSLPTITPTPTPIVAYPGMATRLVIPKINLDAPIVLAPVVNGTWAVDHLDQTIGHLEGTAPPGSSSNLVLAGHVTLSAGILGPFSNLSSLAPGDTVVVYEGNREHLYKIENSQTVSRRNVEVVYPTETGEITLITCINWNSQEGRYSNRLVLKGSLMEQQ